MDDKEQLENLRIAFAVLQEKVKRLEGFMYGGLALILLQLIAMFIMWIKDMMTLKP